MSFRGPPGPPSNVCLGPLGFGVSLTLLPISVRVHEVWGLDLTDGYTLI